MPRRFAVEFRRRAVALVRVGKPITTAAVELGVRAAAVHNWGSQASGGGRTIDIEFPGGRRWKIHITQ
ncbi:MAG: transposase [Microbacteriaceae bacterium]